MGDHGGLIIWTICIILLAVILVGIENMGFQMKEKKDKDKDFEMETTLSYKNLDGSRGWLVMIRPKNGKGSQV